MDVLPFISILLFLFSMILVSEIIKLKKELRKIKKLTGHIKKDIEKIKTHQNEK